MRFLPLFLLACSPKDEVEAAPPKLPDPAPAPTTALAPVVDEFVVALDPVVDVLLVVSTEPGMAATTSSTSSSGS